MATQMMDVAMIESSQTKALQGCGHAGTESIVDCSDLIGRGPSTAAAHLAIVSTSRADRLAA
jgi:hypothetical protein